MCKMIYCPQCRSVEVRKITAIISQETVHSKTETNVSGLGWAAGGVAVGVGASTTEHHQESNLCKRLRLPEPPKKSLLPVWFYVAAIFTGMIFLGSIGSLGKSGTLPQGLVGLFVFTPLLGWLSYWLWQKKPLAEENNRLIQARWEEIKRYWAEAYYCGRCDGVFKPGENSSRPLVTAWLP